MRLIFTLTNVSSGSFMTSWMGCLPQAQMAPEFAASLFHERPSRFLYWSATITTSTFSSRTVWISRSCATSQWFRLICIIFNAIFEASVGMPSRILGTFWSQVRGLSPYCPPLCRDRNMLSPYTSLLCGLLCCS